MDMNIHLKPYLRNLASMPIEKFTNHHMTEDAFRRDVEETIWEYSMAGKSVQEFLSDPRVLEKWGLTEAKCEMFFEFIIPGFQKVTFLSSGKIINSQSKKEIIDPQLSMLSLGEIFSLAEKISLVDPPLIDAHDLELHCKLQEFLISQYDFMYRLYNGDTRTINDGFSGKQKELIIKFARENYPSTSSTADLDTFVNNLNAIFKLRAKGIKFENALKSLYEKSFSEIYSAQVKLSGTQVDASIFTQWVNEATENHIQNINYDSFLIEGMESLGLSSETFYKELSDLCNEDFQTYKTVLKPFIENRLPIKASDSDRFAIIYDNALMGRIMSKAQADGLVTSELRGFLKEKYGITQITGRNQDSNLNIRIDPSTSRYKISETYITGLRYRKGLRFIRARNPLNPADPSNYDATEFKTLVGFTVESLEHTLAGDVLAHRISVLKDRFICVFGDETTASEMSSFNKDSRFLLRDPLTGDSYILDGLVQSAFHIPLEDGKYLVVPELAFGIEIWDQNKEWVTKAGQFEASGENYLIPMIYTAQDHLYSQALRSAEMCPNVPGQPNYILLSDSMRDLWQQISKSKVEVEIGGETYRVNELPAHEIRDSVGTLLRPGLIENMQTILNAIIQANPAFKSDETYLDENLILHNRQEYLLLKIQLAFGYDPAPNQGWFKGKAHRTQQFWYNQRVQNLPRARPFDVSRLLTNPDFDVFGCTSEELDYMLKIDEINNWFYRWGQIYFYKYDPL